MAAPRDRLGVLNINLYSGANLIAADLNGLSDPFVRMGLVSKVDFTTKWSKTKDFPKKTAQKSRIKYKTLNPDWNEHFSFDIQNYDDSVIVFQVWDHDKITAEDPLGFTGVSVSDCTPNVLHDFPAVQLLGVKSGSIAFDLKYIPDVRACFNLGSK